MEDFGSRGPDALHTCLEEVCSCDAIVVLLGHRYGSLVPELGLSYTEAEYERAQECDVEVFAYVKAGFDQAWEHDDEPLRLLAFRNALEDAHTIRRPYFADADELGQRVREDIGRWANALTRRPRFFGRPGAVRDRHAYAAGSAKQLQLRLHPFRIGLVDLSVLDSYDYRIEGTKRVRDKVFAVHDQLLEQSGLPIIFNQIQSDAPDRDSLVDARVQQITEHTDLLIFIAKGEADLPAVSRFAGSTPPRSIWYPQRLDPPDVPADAHRRPYTDSDLNDCSLALRIIDFTLRRIDRHLVETAGI